MRGTTQPGNPVLAEFLSELSVDGVVRVCIIILRSHGLDVHPKGDWSCSIPGYRPSERRVA